MGRLEEDRHHGPKTPEQLESDRIYRNEIQQKIDENKAILITKEQILYEMKAIALELANVKLNGLGVFEDGWGKEDSLGAVLDRKKSINEMAPAVSQTMCVLENNVRNTLNLANTRVEAIFTKFIFLKGSVDSTSRELDAKIAALQGEVNNLYRRQVQLIRARNEY